MQNKQYQFLKDKWVKKHKSLQESFSEKHRSSFQWLSENSKQLALGSLGGLMILTSPIHKTSPNLQVKVASQEAQKIDNKVFLISDLLNILPNEVRPLTTEEETKIGDVLSKSFSMKINSVLNGLRLNRSYGYIGAEQHLRRYPQDSMATHFDNPGDGEKYYSSGMAPGLGAWGYFTTSSSQMTPEDSLREKYYIAVQTFLAPDFNSKVAEYRDFFKFRKMLVVNPQNGKAVVTVIGDAGPADWTGKHLGGSPEVMKHLERVDGTGKGPVLYYFIDDPDDLIPLGPIEPIGNS